MASNVVWSTIYLGQLGDMDADERLTFYDDTSQVVGKVFGSQDDPLYDHVVGVRTDSADSTIWRDNTNTDDTLSFDVGDGPVTSHLDSFGLFQMTIEFKDGSTQTGGVYIFQDTQGHTFLSSTGTIGGFTNKGIVSIQVNSAPSGGVDGWSQWGQAMNKFVCFTPGALVATPTGNRHIESLKAGDLVLTVDHGPQEVLWIGTRKVEFGQDNQAQRPVCISRRALGENIPSQDLFVSPQHCLALTLVSDGEEVDVLVRASHLLGRNGIDQPKTSPNVTYISLLLPQHSLLIVNGAVTESLYPGDYTLDLLTPIQRLELAMSLPNAFQKTEGWYGIHARPVLTRKQVKQYLGQNPLAGLSAGELLPARSATDASLSPHRPGRLHPAPAPLSQNSR